MVVVVRYVLPAAVFVGGLLLYVIEPNATGLEGMAMAIGAAAAIVLLNLLFRAGVAGDRERDEEEAAREFYARHGRWPDEQS